MIEHGPLSRIGNCPGAAVVDKAELHIGAVAFIQRFGSSLNGHVHFHVCVVAGMFEAAAGEPWISRNRPFVVVTSRQLWKDCHKQRKLPLTTVWYRVSQLEDFRDRSAAVRYRRLRAQSRVFAPLQSGH